MLDVKWIVENPEKFNEIMHNRQQSYKVDEIVALSEKRKLAITKTQELQQQRNSISAEIAQVRKSGQNADDLMEKSKKINEQLKLIQQNQNDELSDLLLKIPNLYENDVPTGISEADNQEVEKWGELPEFNFKPKQHFDLGEKLNLLDFKQAAVISGSRFSVFKGNLSKLERALSNFMLDVAGGFDYEEISPPLLVKNKAMLGSGQLPKFADEAFCTKDGFWLIPTAEVPLVNLVQGKMLQESELPKRFVSYTPCFRSEAGAAGKDTRGLIREHQFKKVELVSIVTEEESQKEHERMTNIACEVLQKLKLPYRKMLLCSGDMGFGAQKTYDLEVWLPGQGKYREISSCSNCGDFQARRLKARYKNNNKETKFVHTLNGSSLAIGRTIVAILENYQAADGSVKIPEVLKKYLGGLNKI
ncbi:serine--tRNA ligase [Flavobacteriaceae bacterium]|nr:serine--tRNA ligase [Flavobacteriaceae bacterium]